jgi:hypothetical protein
MHHDFAPKKSEMGGACARFIPLVVFCLFLDLPSGAIAQCFAKGNYTKMIATPLILPGRVSAR